MIQNLDVFESDSIIIDLEDSVTTYDKDAARVLVSNFLQEYHFDTVDIFVRLNDLYSPYFKDDIALLDDLDIKGYVIPKAVPEMIKEIASMTTKELIPIIESPMAVLRMEEIATIKGVTGLLLGGEDLTKDLGVKRTFKADEIFYARSKMAMISSAYNILSIDTPWTDKDNLEGLKADTEYAKGLGFTSKSSIHPNHVDVINDIFTPSKFEINEAQRIVIKAAQSKKGAFSLDGKMIDLPVIERAKKIIEKAKKYNLL
jgi:citrate lyase subunit beta/citryl-CoA lyase